jgi:hypothetical protein
MALFAGLLGIGAKIVTGVKTFIQNSKLQGGFTLKGGDQTDVNRASASVWKTIPIYVWGILAGFLLLLFTIVSRKR